MLTRRFFFVLCGFFFLFIQAHPLLPLETAGARPDLIFLLVVFIGLYFSPLNGALLTIFFSYSLETLSAANEGLYVFSNFFVFFILKIFLRYFSFDSFFKYLFALFACYAARCLVFVFLFYFIYEHNFLGLEKILFRDFIITAAVAPFVFFALKTTYNPQKETPQPAYSSK